MFSLCIPTMDRYDNFLKLNLSKYIENELIDEIVITDENGNDIEKIKKNYNSEKLKLIKNDSRLGPFLNKIKACTNAKNEWIALIDSDNFADFNYFLTGKYYIQNIIGDKKNIILAPSKANPNFDYSHLSGLVYKKNNFTINRKIENIRKNTNNIDSVVLMNTGNYIINKYLIDNLNLCHETQNINCSSACDVIYLNTLLFEQLDLNLHVVPHLEYIHIVHNESIYLQTRSEYEDFNKKVHDRYNNII